jgi:hypothetical protein
VQGCLHCGCVVPAVLESTTVCRPRSSVCCATILALQAPH